MAGTRKPIDWPDIEADYRKTDTPIRELARWYRVDERGIRDRAKRYGWVRTAKDAPRAPIHRQLGEPADEKRVEQAAETIAAAFAGPAPPSPTCAADLLGEAYATLRDVMANSPFPAPRVSAAKAVVEFARLEAGSKGQGGKKGERAAAAEKVAAGGRFAVPAAPKLVVSNP